MRERTTVVKRIASLLAVLLVVNGLLLVPHWLFPPPGGAPWFALEASFLAGLSWLLPSGRRSLRILLPALAAVVVILSGLAFADAATWVILARPLNLYLDLPLVSSVLDLLVGAIGPLLAVVVILAASLLAFGLVALVALLLAWGRMPSLPEDSRFRAPSRPPPGRKAGIRLWGNRLTGAALMVPILVWFLIPHLPVSGLPVVASRVGTPAVDLIAAQSSRLSETLRERREFEELLTQVPASYESMTGLLERLAGRDVVLAFIESYGVSAIDDSRYAQVIQPRLQEFGRQMEEAGLALVSGTLVAPTQGGQSWFSHASLLSGLWLDNQLRYDLMLGSGRETLVDDFRRAGYETVALMPAITFAWPEGERLRYDRIFGRADIPYAGPPLNWVTMPDQFSWHFLERRIRGSGKREGTRSRPLFVEAGLISSHAPWTPILPILEDWDSIGNGEVFAQWAGAGERPEDLWLDPERVRDHFALSIDYALGVMSSYAERYADDRVLLIVMGDHQPAPLITGEGASWEVPVHVISGDPGLVEPFLDWGFLRGPSPSRLHSDRGMDEFRDWFVRAYSRATSPGGARP